MALPVDELWKIEEGFWLKGQSHYREYVHADCLFCLPEPTGLMVGSGFIDYLPNEAGFIGVSMNNKQVTRPARNVAVLAYQAVGTSVDGTTRSVSCTSTYVLEGDAPQLVQHQQSIEDASV